MYKTSQQTIDYLSFIKNQLNLYIPITLLVLGSIGHVLNILVFTRPLVRKHSCSIYFTSASVANFVSLYVGLITPFLGSFYLDPTQTFNVLCKIRFYLRYSTITLSTWFILLACIDRLFSSSRNVNIRLWSSLRIAKFNVIVATVICFIGPYSQVFYCYNIKEESGCLHTNKICKLLNDVILLICNSGIPPILMVILNILTIRNIRYFSGNFVNRYHNRRNLQLIRLLFIQVCSLILFGIPIVSQKIYSCSTLYLETSLERKTIDNFIIQVCIEISYISNSAIFYTYSLTNKIYRKEVICILSSIFTCCRPIQIQPA